jgi:hypothetical protein
MEAIETIARGHELLTTGEVAERLRVIERTVRRWGAGRHDPRDSAGRRRHPLEDPGRHARALTLVQGAQGGLRCCGGACSSDRGRPELARPRSLKLIAAEGMVTLIRPLDGSYRDGTEERLLPNRHRFAPEHELVAQAPEDFRLCMPKGDRTDAPERFRAALRAADRGVAASARRPAASPCPHIFELQGGEPWRL